LVESNVPPKAAETAHELSDLSPKNIALFGITLAVTLVGVLLITYALFRHFYNVELSSQIAPSPLSYTPEPTPEPHLLVNPGQSLKTMRAAEEAILNSYEWVDREQGLVRVPINRAIEILAERGLPARRQSDERTFQEGTNRAKESKDAKGRQR
jgi:hypothetical protein